jgi:hypothetical protein
MVPLNIPIEGKYVVIGLASAVSGGSGRVCMIGLSGCRAEMTAPIVVIYIEDRTREVC